MLIAQISDTHIVVKGEKAYGMVDTRNNLLQCIAHLNGYEPRIDLVLLTGDMTQSGRREEFEEAKLLLQNLCMPWYVVPGNHDDRAQMRAVIDMSNCPPSDNNFIQYVVETDALRLIALDSTVSGESAGAICEERAQWLDDCLAQAPDKSSLIFMHHPPIKFGVIETDVEIFTGLSRLGEVVGRYQNIVAILCGHIHTPAHALWRRTVVSTAPSISMQLVVDFNLQRDEFVLRQPAFQLHRWVNNQLITHTINVDDQDVIYPF